MAPQENIPPPADALIDTICYYQYAVFLHGWGLEYVLNCPIINRLLFCMVGIRLCWQFYLSKQAARTISVI